MNELTKSLLTAVLGGVAAVTLISIGWWAVGAMVGIAIRGAKWVIGL